MLGVLLESAVSQSQPFDEIVVSDDASGDETMEVARPFGARARNLVIASHAKNVGLIANFDAAVSMASSEYVWFFGDDDRLRPGAVERVKASLARHPSAIGMTVGAIHYDSHLARPVSAPRRRPHDICYGADQLFQRHADLLGFMSTLIIRRDAWVAAKSKAGDALNLYEHVRRIALALGEDGCWLISTEPVVDYRSDNDQFIDFVGGRDQRILLDVTAYAEIFRECFANNPHTYSRATASILKTHVISRLVNDRAGGRANFGQLGPALVSTYVREPTFWCLAVPILLTPPRVLTWLRKLYRMFAPTAGRARLARLAN